jgi:hypothetical protein
VLAWRWEALKAGAGMNGSVLKDDGNRPGIINARECLGERKSEVLPEGSGPDAAEVRDVMPHGKLPPVV